MKACIIAFPGTNCERNTYWALYDKMGINTDIRWYSDILTLEDYSLVIIPGGFSFGDYLRPGALASITPVMDTLKKFADTDGLIMGICNGFQILTEAKILPGKLMRNKNGRFISDWIYTRIENVDFFFINSFEINEVCLLPIAHFDGWYYFNDCEKVNVALKYSSPSGEISSEFNPDGTKDNIAGILSDKGNVFGLMPHPERAMESQLGSSDGLKFFLSILDELSKGRW